jgi:predicted enzyme related to lactoylglutathione lyase
VTNARRNNVTVELIVNIDVEHLESAIRFYQEAVGMRLKRRLFDDTVAELSGAAAPVFLLQKAVGSRPSPIVAGARSYRRHWTPVHLDFVVAALEPAVERAVQAGARAEGPIQSFDWGRQALMSDPFGNGFCLVQWRGGGYDAVAPP